MKRLQFHFFCLGALLFWTPCFSSSFDLPAIDEDFLLPQPPLTDDNIDRPLADSQKIVEMTELLRPLLFSTFGDFELESWYARKEVWIPHFGDSKSILFIADKIYREYRQANKLSEAASVKNAISRIYSRDGNYSKAIEESLISYELAQRIEETTAIGWNLTCLSDYYFRAGNHASSLEYAQRAIDVSHTINHPGIESSVLLIIGGVKAEKSEYDSSLQLVTKALKIAEKYGLDLIEKKAALNTTFIYNRQEKYDETIAFLNENIDFFGLSASLPNIFLCFNLYGAYKGKKDFEKATSYLDLGCEMANNMNLRYAVLSCEEYRIELYEAQGLYQQALEASQKSRKVQTELKGIEQSQAIQSLTNRLTLLEKNLEIERLNIAQKESQRKNQLYTRNLTSAMLFLFLLIPGTYFFMRKRNQVKFAEQQRKIAEAKIQVLQSQMHPHFIFNTLNGIQNYILKSKKIEAYNYLGKFATLLRTLTKTYTQAHINLDQEIEFIRSYMEIEKLRFRESFVYSITVAPELTGVSSMIPRMIIQPIVENALIHGITGLKRQGLIEIRINPSDNGRGICCVVTDDGRGREAAAEMAKEGGEKGHLSIATANTEKRINFLHRLGYKEVAVTIEDLYEDGKAAGTKVSLFLPYLKEIPIG